MQLLEENPNITLDQAILSFENATTTSLRIFAEKKGRTREMYHNTYSSLFETARKQFIQGQKQLEQLIYKNS